MRKPIISLITGLALAASVRSAAAQGTAFTYQGQLINGGSPVTGTYDLTFTLFTTNITGTAVASPITNSAIGVTNGLFTTLVDFGPGIFVGTSNWLSIGVRTNDTGTFATLAPRQPVTPTPYAIYSTTAGSAATATIASSAGTVSAANITGTLGLTQLPAVVITNNATNVTLIGTFTGNGAGLTNVADWHLTGNIGTTNGNFLGTTDGQPLEIRAGGVRVAWFSSGTLGPNIVLGPAQNLISSNGTAGSSILGGSNNLVAAGASYSILGGGGLNNLGTNASYSVIGGGQQNILGTGSYNSFIGGGQQNTIQPNAYQSVLVGGDFNFIYAGDSQSVLVGGDGNVINSGGAGSVLVGGYGNQIFSEDCFIGGGAANEIQAGALYSTVAGGTQNINYGATYGTIAGGYANSVQFGAVVPSIGGGYDNLIQTYSSYAVIAGGYQNTVGGSAKYSVIGGGEFNTASNSFSTVSGGYLNLALGNYATVPGGSNNVASGANSFAAGTSAQATNTGAFVWADASSGAFFSSTNNNSFNVRAAGGVSFSTSGGGLKLDGNTVLTNGEPGVTLAGSFNGVFSGSFGGSGSGLTGLNASDLSSGTVPLAQLPSSLTQLPAIVVTNNEPSVSLGGLTLSSGGLIVSLPFTINSTYTPLPGRTFDIGVFYEDLNENFAAGPESAIFSGSFTNNIALGYLGGYNLTNGNNNIDIGNLGTNGDNGIIRIGTPGVQTQTYLAGVINGNAGGLTSLNASQLTGTLPLADLPGSVVTNGEPFVGLEVVEAVTLNADYVGVADTLEFGVPATITSGGVPIFSADSNENTALGSDAGGGEDVGSTNIAIGAFAGSQITGNNNIDIGNAGASSDNGIIRIGTTGVHTQTFLAGTINCPSISSGPITSSGPVSAASLTSSGPTTCGSLTITGGSDLAEPFAISKEEQVVSDGEVVVIDEANPGQLTLTDRPYDTRVAGVVSGANGIHPGIQMHQEGLLDGGRNVALTGRVYVQADTSNGPIKPGDMLTTSRTPGRAMRVSDHARAQGAILGKAMTALKAGHGMVLVLVTLQ